MSDAGSTSAVRPSRARRAARLLARLVAGLAVVAVGGAVFVYVASERRIAQRFEVTPEVPTIPASTDAAALAHGEHLARTRGCLECHGAHGEGRVAVDAMPVMVAHAPNLTAGGVTAHYTDADWTRTIRHCVRPDGRSLLFMPCEDFRQMDGNDLGALVAYLRTLPAVDRTEPPFVLGPLGRVLLVTNEFPVVVAEHLDHAARVPEAPAREATPAFGRYLAHACTGCHGPNFSGGRIPGTPPEWPPSANLTPDETGLRGWTRDQFVAVLREGRLPDGRVIDPRFMPWNIMRELEDVEVDALWAFVQSLPARPRGGR